MLHEPIQMLVGVKIFYNIRSEQKTNKPIKIHVKKDWMSENYHKRIQKKWNKRHGFHWVPCMYRTPHGIVAHPSFKPKIEAMIKQADIDYRSRLFL